MSETDTPIIASSLAGVEDAIAAAIRGAGGPAAVASVEHTVVHGSLRRSVRIELREAGAIRPASEAAA